MMLRKISCFAVCLALLSASAAVNGQIITDVKTPPLRNSDTFRLPAVFHSAGGVTNWAGSRMKVHVKDPGEVDVDGIHPVHPTTGSTGGLSPFGPRSENRGSSPLWFTVWHPAAQQSGITIEPGVFEPTFDIDLHAKGTTLGQNSDVDITLMFWNIRHLGEGPGSGFLTVKESDYVYANPGSNPLAQSEIPTNPPPPGQGTWIHVAAGQTHQFHTVGGPGSFFYATFTNAGTIGIEHIPEPTSALLLAGGIITGLIGVRSRRKRRLIA